MATIDFGRVSALPPLALLSQALPRLSRHQLEAAVELLIDRMDEIDGNSDVEANGDELDGSNAEDDYGGSSNVGIYDAPGCPIADPDLAVDDSGCDEDTDREPDDFDEAMTYDLDQSVPHPPWAVFSLPCVEMEVRPVGL